LKLRVISLTMLFIVHVMLFISAVYAPWSTLGTGYAITSNYHGEDVIPSTPVTVTAGTLDQNIVQVTFRWHEPPDGNGPIAREEAKLVEPNGTMGEWNNGTTALILYANDTYAPDIVGDWGVQAFFQDSAGTEKAGLENVVMIRATSFNTIPEIPVGTISATVTMLIALVFFMGKKKSTGKIHFRA